MSTGGAVPVLMYHSVGRYLPDWAWSGKLTVPAVVFEDHLRWLRKAGYRSATLDELDAHSRDETRLPEKTVVLTFDDGYVDNWTYVVPLLAKYGFTGSIMITTEFADPRDVVRPTLEDAWVGRVREDELEVRGFMSWPELKQAVDRGVLSVQCHAVTHTWYPTGPKVVDFHHPRSTYYWLDWNAAPKEKPFYLQDPGNSAVPWGTPVYEYAKSLEATRYFPNPKETRHLVEYVKEKGGERFFDRPDRRWRAELRSVVDRIGGGNESTGRHETAAERRARMTAELVESKREIESRLGVTVDYLIWPGGGFSDESFQIAQGIFKAVTFKPRGGTVLRNRPNENPGKICRKGIPVILHGNRIAYPGGRYLISFLDEFRQVPLARRQRQAQKLVFMIGMRTGVWPRYGAAGTM